MASTETAWALYKGNDLTDFSEQQLVDCSVGITVVKFLFDQTDFGNEGCEGGFMDKAFQYILKNGLEKSDVYKYNATDGECKYDSSKVLTCNTILSSP